ncbi:DUF294 nucleotidyltransferase-like domain-containing protein [Halomonas sp. Bachu 37]|uniref:DUF294 nucleotidyltransferase-like domain-containing protein n=1 Tax=Halomonas kashgarensis TaxID=3084920 RepID=UPI0032180BAC
MRLVHRASPWREMISARGELASDTLLAPLESAFTALDSLSSTATHAWQPHLVDALVRYDLPAWRIAQILSDHNDWLYRQAIAQSLAEMQAQGWGPPPVVCCILTLGSTARHESLLGPDQDNAMIVADYPDERHVEIDGYFQALGERFTRRLDEAGIPLCHGHVMARWPMWRKRANEWHEQLRIWSGDRRVKRVQQTNILLDFSPVWGDASLARQLWQSVVTLLPAANLFLDEMASLLDELPVALDRLGRLRGRVDVDAPHDGAIDLKRQGLLPLVSAVRLLALMNHCSEVGTRERLTALGNLTGGLDLAQATTLRAGFDRLQHLVLDQQRYNLSRRQAADGWVDITHLREDERMLLKFDLQQIRRLVGIAQDRVRHGGLSR